MRSLIIRFFILLGLFFPALASAATAPGVPTAVTATAGDSQLTVNFTPPASDGGSPITGYTVNCRGGGVIIVYSGIIGAFSRLTPLLSSPAVISGLRNGTSYTCTVNASNSVGAGAESSPSNAVTPNGPIITAPGVPTTVTATAGDAQATVGFSPPANDGGSPITGYEVGYTSSASQWVTSNIYTGTTVTVTGLANGTTYSFIVKAINSAGWASAWSSASNNVTPIGKSNQTISFGSAPTVAIGGTGAVSATATSGLPVSYSSITPSVCTVSGSTVTGITAGTCTIAANQAGNTSYNAATQVTQSITSSTGTNDPALIGTWVGSGANNAGETITFTSTTITQQGTNSNWCQATYSYTTSGNTSYNFVVTTPDGRAGCPASGTVPYSISGNILTTSSNPVGTWTRSSGIGKVSQTISFGGAPTVAIGGTGTVSATATSGLPVSYSSTTPSVCTASGSTVTGVGAGTCTIAANQAGNTSYNAAVQVTQNITIGMASQISISDVRVFAFAEANYSSIFTGTPTIGQTTYQGTQYNYRYYPTSGNYLAIDTSGVISILGPYTGNVVTVIGPVESFRSYITAWETTQQSSTSTGTIDPALIGTWVGSGANNAGTTITFTSTTMTQQGNSSTSCQQVASYTTSGNTSYNAVITTPDGRAGCPASGTAGTVPYSISGTTLTTSSGTWTRSSGSSTSTIDPALVGKWAMGIPGTSYIANGWLISGTGATEGTLTINSDGSYSWATPWNTYTGTISRYSSSEYTSQTNWGTLTDGMGSYFLYLQSNNSAITLIDMGTGFFGLLGGRTH